MLCRTFVTVGTQRTGNAQGVIRATHYLVERALLEVETMAAIITMAIPSQTVLKWERMGSACSVPIDSSYIMDIANL